MNAIEFIDGLERRRSTRRAATSTDALTDQLSARIIGQLPDPSILKTLVRDTLAESS